MRKRKRARAKTAAAGMKLSTVALRGANGLRLVKSATWATRISRKLTRMKAAGQRSIGERRMSRPRIHTFSTATEKLKTLNSQAAGPGCRSALRGAAGSCHMRLCWSLVRSSRTNTSEGRTSKPTTRRVSQWPWPAYCTTKQKTVVTAGSCQTSWNSAQKSQAEEAAAVVVTVAISSKLWPSVHRPAKRQKRAKGSAAGMCRRRQA